MTWAARYSRTEQPELTIYRDGVEVSRMSTDDRWFSRILARSRNAPLVADIAARVPVRECIETDACRNHAVDGERCWDHGGSDPL